MNAQWRKEIRLVLPVWLPAVGLPVAALWLLPGELGQDWAAFLTVLGVALLGSSSFGPEFNHGTMGQLLVQPIERRRLWLMKMAVLAVALVPFVVGMLIVQRAWQEEPSIGLVCFVPLCAFCATPALTLLSRNGPCATMLTIAFPPMLCGILVAVGMKAGGRVDFPEQPDQFARTILRACFGLLSIYCVGACWLGYRLFMRFQVADTLTRALPLEKIVEAPLAGILNVLFARRPGAFASLLRKEIRLQHGAFLIAAGFVLILAIVVIALPLFPQDYQQAVLTLPVVLLAGSIPLVMGAHSVAEERNLGVHAWQLTFPVPLGKQWLAKLLVTLGGSFVFGVMLPWLFVAAGYARLHDLKSLVPDNLWPVLFIVLGQMLFTALAMYASSLSSTTLRAITACVALLTAIGVSLNLFGKIVNETGLWDHLVSATRQIIPAGRLVPYQYPEETMALAAMTFLLLLLGFLAFSNFRHVEITARRRWGQVILFLVPVPILLISFTLLAYVLSMPVDG